MKPQKKSIRDFFSPVPRDSASSQESPTALPRPNASNAPTPRSNTSTTSGLALRAIPNAADTPLSSSNPGTSKRTTSNGEEVVLNSDSDDDSLPDLDFGIPTPKAKPAPTTTATTTTTTITTRSKRMVDHDDDGLRKPTKKPKDDKRKFHSLVQTAQKNLETERRIQEHKAALEEAEEVPVTKRTNVDEEVLGQVVQDGDDPEKARRLFQAMQRTNATQMEPTFHFFEETTDTIPVRNKFPINCLPRHRWSSNFQEPNTRDQAFMTGFAQQIFRMRELPKELASWMIDQLSVPRSEIKASLPPSLKSIARLLASSAPWLCTNARRHALYLLCHTCLDDRVTADADMLLALQDAIEAVIYNFADNIQLTSGVRSPSPQEDVHFLIFQQLSEVIPQMLARIAHPILQRNLICALPAKSPLTAYLQRHLALSFLVHPTPVNTSLSDYKTHNLLMEHLATSPNFRVNKDTDYSHLAARLAILDIAIGPGLLTVPYQPLPVPTPSQTGLSPMRAPMPASSEIKDFNKEIDALARKIKLLGNSIVEAGAVVDITILETKDFAERTHARLEHVLRIGGKKVHNVFGNEEEDTQLRVNKFFKKPLEASASTSRSTLDNEDTELDLVDPSKT
ncbi:hypothetical protein DDE82_002361 [Stemphylium lycopersici]|uniref:Uncharacterized protein n=1 Tax=Stemphylium lycopersici TaxID=183478 RepID=A0A364NGD9_STELY|nr:hypothetical protein TW65_03203 [Stemphylium lycopersici]RAR08380.1 hypothetical protein DDE82_002361 [Stemphylium lycopersici]RAR16322.1 hypothetical protein DDE83_000194 [Stemphylium lycopersici]